MDAGVVSDFRPQAFASRTAAENFKNRGLAPVGLVENSRLPVATRPPQPKVARGHLLCCHSSPMRSGIAFVAAPHIWPRGARNAAPHAFSAACYFAIGPVAAILSRGGQGNGRRRASRSDGPAGDSTGTRAMGEG